MASLQKLQTRNPTESEFIEWRLHPATQALFGYLENLKQENKDRWSAGDFVDDTNFKTTALNIAAIAQCKLVDLIIDIEYEQLLGEKDGESERPETLGASGSS